jgi:hypothetical protein
MVESQVPANAVAGLAKMNAGKPLAHLDKAGKIKLAESVISRYVDGEKTADIAAELGVHRVRLNQILLAVAEQPWVQAQVALALARKQEAEEEMDGAADGLTLARARERLKSAQWDLERVFRRVYGEEKAQINVHGDGVKIELVSYSTLDVVPERTLQPSAEIDPKDS